MAKVSVVVPVYNVEEYLPRCVESLHKQTMEDIEVILVDDGSPDGCPALCDRCADEDTRIRVIHKPNGGVSAARNDGLAAATGEYVIFCDSDDWMAEDGLRALYDEATRTGADVTIGDVYLENAGGSRRVRFYAEPFAIDDKAYISELLKADIYRTYCPNPPAEGCAFGYGGPWNKLVRREFLVENGIDFDVRLKGIFDDILYTAHLLAHASTVAYVQEPVYHYRIVEGSLTHAYRPNVVEVNEAIFAAWEELFATLDEPDRYLPAYYACVLRRTEEAIRTYFAHDKNPKGRRELRREFKSLQQREPYRSALRNADLSKVSKKQALIASMGKMGLSSLALSIVGR